MFGGTGFYLGSLGLEHNTANALKLQGLENSVNNEGACVFAALLMYWVLLFPKPFPSYVFSVEVATCKDMVKFSNG